MAKEGVDYSWARPGGAALKAAGKEFAVRYIPYPGHGGKGLNAAELADLRANGVAVALVFESYAGRALEGRGAGKQDAEESQRQVEALGMPKDLPIYFAVDFDAAENQQAAIDDYLRGAADAIGVGRVGVYGGYYVVKRCHENSTATYLWQTYAWSGGQVLDGIHLFQYLNGQNLNGAVDFCKALQDNYGQLPADAPAPQPQPTPVQPANGSYTVKSGDTLSGIANRYGTTYQELARINNISDPNKIFPGQVLRLSGSTPAPAPVTGGQVYTVLPGDTLSGIGDKFGVSYQSIAQVNNIADPNKIFAGQRLTIPGGGASPPPAVKAYTVVSGDTLSGIASKFGTTYQALASYNGIANPDKILPGQIIRIP
jgi:LysM repeat protein